MQYIRSFLLLFVTLFTTAVIAQVQISSVHQAQKGETLSSLSAQYGLTIEEILSVNPEMSPKPNKKIKKGYLVNIPGRKEVVLTQQDTFCLAVVLPLSSTGKEGERCLEYYRGLLMAADKVRENGRVIKIVAIDEPGAKKNIEDVVDNLYAINPDAIVGPLYPQHFQAMSTLSLSLDVKLLVPFSSKVSEVEFNPNIYLLNAPAVVVQENSFQLLNNVFKNRRFVIVRTNDASDRDVVNYWNDKLLMQRGDVKYLSQNFNQEDLFGALSLYQSNVILLDGSNQENVLNILKKVREYTDEATTHSISVVGHNAWQTFSMEQHELLGALDTHILSQNYYNAFNKQVIDFEEAYSHWFKEYPLPLHPRMGELGYDTGLYLFTADKGNSLKDMSGNAMNYLQSKLKFQRFGYGGYVNTSLMFLRYGSGNIPDVIE